MSLLPILSLLICLSVHACNGRYLHHVLEKEIFINAKDKDEHSSENIVPPKPMEIEPQGVKEFVKKGLSSHGISLGVSTIEQTASWYDRDEGKRGATSGMKAIVPRYSPDDIQQEAKMKGSIFRVRSMLGFTRSGVKEATESKENETAEDVVEADYAQPHRKPPIHNQRS